MEIEIFTLCDFAQDNNSKLTIVGTFDSINAKNFPVQHPACTIACRLRFAKKEAGNRDFKLRLIDTNAQEIIPAIEGNINIPAPAHQQVITINLVINFNQLKFEKPGRFSFELYIDGDWKTGLPLFLNKID